MVQAVNCELLLYADDSDLIFHHEDVNIRERRPNKIFSKICDLFVHNKLSIHLSEDKTKSILFPPLNKFKKLRKLNISYGPMNIKQYSVAIYLGCILDDSLSAESIALNVVSKITHAQNFSIKKNNFLSPQLKRLLLNALIQSHFDYARSVWYLTLNKKFKTNLQILQKQWESFCSQLDNRAHVGIKSSKNKLASC